MVSNVFPTVVFELKIFSLTIPVTDTVVTTWIIILLLAIISYFTSRNISLTNPSKLQIVGERIVIAIEQAMKSSDSNLPAWRLVPLIGTVWIYVGFMNLISLIPYFHNPTRDLSTTASLAMIAFFAIHYYGIKFSGLKNYMAKYTQPSAFMLPFNIFSDISRIFAMAIRLFGNMLSWEMIIAILITLAGFLVPVPMILLSIVGDLLHAFLFGFLIYIFILGGVEAQNQKNKGVKNG